MRSTDARSQPRDGDRDIQKEAVRQPGTEARAELAAVELGALGFAVVFPELATGVSAMPLARDGTVGLGRHQERQA